MFTESIAGPFRTAETPGGRVHVRWISDDCNEREDAHTKMRAETAEDAICAAVAYGSKPRTVQPELVLVDVPGLCLRAGDWIVRCHPHEWLRACWKAGRVIYERR